MLRQVDGRAGGPPQRSRGHDKGLQGPQLKRVKVEKEAIPYLCHPRAVTEDVDLRAAVVGTEGAALYCLFK